MVLFGYLKQDVALFSNQLLVGSGNALSGFQTAADKLVGRVHTAHALGNIADLRIVQNGLDVVYHTVSVRVIRKFPQVENIGNVQFSLGVLLNFGTVPVKQFNDTGTNDAVS